MKASLLKPLGYFMVFWLILMLLFCLLISESSSSFIKPWGLFKVHQLQMVSPSLSCSIVFLGLEQGPDIHFYFPFF